MKYRFFLHAKIHRATVTQTDINYVGSITIDRELLEASGIKPYEEVQVVSLANGARLKTYVIAAEKGSGVIQLNGAAAHLFNIGQKIIIMAYTLLEEPLPETWAPTIVYVDSSNKITDVQQPREAL